jgi:hypothetical protein
MEKAKPTPIPLGEQFFRITSLKRVDNHAPLNIEVEARSQHGSFSVHLRDGIAQQLRLGEEFVLIPARWFDEPRER